MNAAEAAAAVRRHNFWRQRRNLHRAKIGLPSIPLVAIDNTNRNLKIAGGAALGSTLLAGAYGIKKLWDKRKENKQTGGRWRLKSNLSTADKLKMTARGLRLVNDLQTRKRIRNLEERLDRLQRGGTGRRKRRKKRTQRGGTFTTPYCYASGRKNCMLRHIHDFVGKGIAAARDIEGEDVIDRFGQKAIRATIRKGHYI